eukprot:gene12311-15474_t
MTCTVAKKTSLVAHLRECFFGFADSAHEEHFVKLRFQERMTVGFATAVVTCASSIYRALQSEDWSQNPFGCILLEPGAPVPMVFLIWIICTARWRWMEPAVFACYAFRLATLFLWLMCDSASVPAVVQWWSVPTASVASFICFSTLSAVINYLVNVRFIGGLMIALVWVLLAPCMVHRSPADIKSLPLVLAMVAVVLVRLFGELSTRSKFLNLYYTKSEVKDHRNSTAKVNETAGCSTIKNEEAGNSTAKFNEAPGCSTINNREAGKSTAKVNEAPGCSTIKHEEVKESVYPTTDSKDSGYSTSGCEESSSSSAKVKEFGTAPSDVKESVYPTTGNSTYGCREAISSTAKI